MPSEQERRRWQRLERRLDAAADPRCAHPRAATGPMSSLLTRAAHPLGPPIAAPCCSSACPLAPQCDTHDTACGKIGFADWLPFDAKLAAAVKAAGGEAMYSLGATWLAMTAPPDPPPEPPPDPPP